MLLFRQSTKIVYHFERNFWPKVANRNRLKAFNSQSQAQQEVHEDESQRTFHSIWDSSFSPLSAAAEESFARLAQTRKENKKRKNLIKLTS